MKKFRMPWKAAVPLAAAAVILCAGTVPSAYAYLTDIADRLDNNFTIALDSESTTVEKFPDPDPETQGNTVSYEKAVQAVNTGDIDEYVRIRLSFSEGDIEDKTQFSSDGTNWYSVDDYKNHLPSGWVYNNEDGYYYYTPILPSGNWEEFKGDLVYNAETNTWYYQDGDTVRQLDIITTPLIRYVRTTFDEPADMRSYGINVHTEDCPFYLGGNYAEAWEAYLASMD